MSVRIERHSPQPANNHWRLNALARIAFVWVFMSCAQSNSPSPTGSRMVIQFDGSMTEPWQPLNDQVMGGLSEGTLTMLDSTMKWTGQTRLENNGGFASVRSTWGHHDLRFLNRVVIRCRGEGGPIKLTLETSSRWWMPYAFASFSPAATWTDIELDVREFSWSQAQLGDLNAVRPAKEFGDVLRIGLMKYDGTAESFDLEVASIQFLP